MAVVVERETPVHPVKSSQGYSPEWVSIAVHRPSTLIFIYFALISSLTSPSCLTPFHDRQVRSRSIAPSRRQNHHRLGLRLPALQPSSSFASLLRVLSLDAIIFKLWTDPLEARSPSIDFHI